MSSEKPKFSFGFSQRAKQCKVIQHPIANAVADTPEYITAIEEQQVISTKTEQPFVIPCKRLRRPPTHKAGDQRIKADEVDELTRQALQEIKEESSAASGVASYEAVPYQPILPPPSQEVDMSTAEDADYSAVPIEKFGMALLAGMGFDPDEAKQCDPKSITTLRPKGLGLGADPTVLQAVKKAIQTPLGDKEELSWRSGTRCQLVMGKNEGLYGTLEGIDGDTGRVIVRLTISKQVVRVLQHTVRLVPQKEYNKFSNCLNQSEVERYKDDEAKHISHQPPIRGQMDSAIDLMVEPAAVRSNGTASIQELISSSRESAAVSSFSSYIDDSWLRPNLRVKFLDKRYRNGAYYKDKVTIVNVDNGTCSCRTRSGRMIEGVKPRHLETVVPRQLETSVMIVRGSESGSVGTLIERSSSREQVKLRLPRGSVVKLPFDSVCAIAGSP